MNDTSQPADPSVYSYLDFRAFLRDWFVVRQERDPKFSRRQFARLAGRSSPGFLTEVMDGGRQMTAPVASAVANALSLPKADGAFFEALVELDRATDTRARNQAWERISAAKSFQEARTIDGAAVTYLSNWWFPVVRELVARDDFDPDPSWIAKRVVPAITESQARKAFETLQALGLVAEKGGRFVQTETLVTTPHEVQGLAVHNYHLGMLERASESIDRFPSEERHLVAATVCVPASLIPRLKQELNAAQARILDLANQFEGAGEQVVQVHMLLFPLSDRAESKEGT